MIYFKGVEILLLKSLWKGKKHLPCTRFVNLKDCMDKLFLVMPTYNEEENIEKVVRGWHKVLEEKDSESRLVVADAGSTDRTHEILLDLQKEYPQLTILSNTGKFHGPKVIALYDYAIKQGADYVFQTDSDGQTNPDEFGAFWEVRKDYDGIFGCRTARGDGKSRAMVESVLCLLLKVYFGVSIPDANAPFRLLNTAVLKKYLYKMESDFNIPNAMITTYFVYHKESYCFKEISFKPRMLGTNSINSTRIIKIGWKALKDFMRLRKNI